MRVLHVIANLAPRYGGPPKACFEMARAVATRGHEVRIFTTNQDGPDELDVPLDRPVIRDGVEIHYFPVQKPRFWGTSFPMAAALSRAIELADIVHVHSLYLFHNAVAGHYCRKYEIPYIVRPHGTLDPYIHGRHRWRKRIMEAMFENKNMRQASAVHFTSEEEMRLASPYIFGTPGFVVPLGVDAPDEEKLPQRGSFRAKHPKVGTKKVLLFFGRIHPKKGLDVLAKAFSVLIRDRSDTHLAIVGPDDQVYGENVRRWLRQGRALESATFTGMLTGADKWAALRDADIFVLPSYSENFGIAVVEAMACGLPVVISNKVNIWREVESAGAGIVIGCNAEECMQAMAWLLDRPREAREMGAKGAAFVRERFNWSTVGAQLEDVYSRITRGTL